MANEGEQSAKPSLKERILASDGAPAARLNKAAFKALASDIQDALDSNIPMKRIHQQLVDEGALSVSYSTFRNYCREEGLKKAKRPPAPAAERETPKRTFPASKPSKPPRQFTPSTTLDDDDVDALIGTKS